MTTTTAGGRSIEVTGIDLSRVLARAADQRTSIRVKPRGCNPADRIIAVVVQADATRIVIESDQPICGNGNGSDADDRFCDITLSSHRGVYIFSTHVVDVRNVATGVQCDLAPPAAAQLLERRRFVRARLSPSVGVRLMNPSHPGADPVEGQLLNLSEMGLACRVSAAVAQRLRVGQIVTVCFSQGTFADEIELDALVRRKTPGADRAVTVIGLTFVRHDGDQAIRRRIRGVIEERP